MVKLVAERLLVDLDMSLSWSRQIEGPRQGLKLEVGFEFKTRE